MNKSEIWWQFEKMHSALVGPAVIDKPDREMLIELAAKGKELADKLEQPQLPKEPSL